MSKDPILDTFGVESDMVQEDESVSLDNPFPEPSTDESDLEDILSAPTSAEDIASRQSGLFLETGVYRWKVAPTVVTSFSTEDKKPSDIAQKQGRADKGRCLISFSGTVVGLTIKKEGRYSFSISPDIRKLVDQDGKDTAEDDFFTKNYALVELYYFKKYERNPTNPLALVQMIKEGKYAINIRKGKDDKNYFNRLEDLKK